MHWLVHGFQHSQATEILNRFASQQIVLLAPRQITDEVASTLSKLHRRKIITAVEAIQAYERFANRRPILIDGPALASCGFELALEHQISFWDSLYLALAAAQRADLVTADERFYRSVSRHYPFVRLLD